jgi:hypothetical protein
MATKRNTSRSTSRGGGKRATSVAKKPARRAAAKASKRAPEFLDIAPLKGKLTKVAIVAVSARAPGVPPRKRIHKRRLIPRVPTGAFQADARPTGALSLRRPLDLSAGARGIAVPLADTDTIAFTRNVQLNDVATADSSSHVCEPSVAINGDVVFFTGNWFAAVSTDGGQTFRHVDPYRAFPDPPGMEFCCDQVVHYIRKIDTFVWLLQYTEDEDGNNLQRLAFATTAEVREGRWRLFDITSQGLGLPGVFLDYPDLAVGTNRLYVTMNGFRGNAWDSTILVRLPLAGIRSGTISADRFVSRDNFNFRVAQNCGTTAYFASHNTSSQIRVFKWRESAAQPTFKDVDVATWDEGNFSSITPDNHNWLERADPRMTGATLANGELWFAWGSNRGGANHRPHPFVQIARLKASTLSLLENVSLWNASYAICYAALATNSRKEVGASYAIGGGDRHPSHVVGILTGTRREVETFAGNRGPRDAKWGDYLAVRRAYPNQKLFVASGYTLQAGTGTNDATPNLTIFGRSSDV